MKLKLSTHLPSAIDCRDFANQVVDKAVDNVFYLGHVLTTCMETADKEVFIYE